MNVIHPLYMYKDSGDRAWQISNSLFFNIVCYKILILHLLESDVHEEESALEF